jgi:gamma-glutamyltranspeptidase/glutathione hydrolase
MGTHGVVAAGHYLAAAAGHRIALAGGDIQDQVTVGFFLAHADFGLDIQDALDVPAFWTDHVPSSFYPRASCPGVARLENAFDPSVVEALRRRGHTVTLLDGLSLKMMAVLRDEERGVLRAGTCSTAGQAHALAW